MIIYKTTNLINGKIYIGKDIHNNKRYLGSGKILKQAIKKYGKDNFSKEIIDTAKTIDELNQKEIYWIKFFKSQDRNIGYNICDGDNFGYNINMSNDRDKIISKIKLTNKGKKRTIEQRKRLSNSLKGRIITQETRKKMGESRKNKNYKPSAKNIELTINRLKKLKYEKNLNAKKFIVIDPNHKEYIVIGSLPEFCKNKNININILRKWVNKGPVKRSNRKPNNIIINNTTNWELRST